LELARLEFWQSDDPYGAGNTFGLVKEFAEFMQDQYNLDIYNILTTRFGDNNAIARGIRVLCNPYNSADSSGRYTCSSIALNIIPPYPQYSNVAIAVGHEMGHIIGSRHTHACVWPVLSGGGIGSIDTCVITGENQPCYQSGTQPHALQDGTLMSYCDLGGGNVNASLGFGPLPGDTCRLRYNQAPCLSVGIENISSEIPETFTLYQNYPNPFNPVTYIKFDIVRSSNVKLEIFDIKGSLVEVLFNGFLQSGKYNINWKADSYSSGVYYYKLSSDKISLMNKMILVK
ncbi:MAG: T9SS type A sorting domain-containing protein, partial [bacterium]